MNWGMIRNCNYLCLIVVAAFVWIPAADANDAAALSGTYQVIHKAESGGQARVQLQIHLVNCGSRDLRIQRMTFWDSSHAAKGATQNLSLVVGSANSADTTQEFILPRAEYEQWKRGTRPRLVLEVATPQGRTTTQVIHLGRTVGRNGN